jgi:hypothetical protein
VQLRACGSRWQAIAVGPAGKLKRGRRAWRGGGVVDGRFLHEAELERLALRQVRSLPVSAMVTNKWRSPDGALHEVRSSLGHSGVSLLGPVSELVDLWNNTEASWMLGSGFYLRLGACALPW